MAGSIAFGGLSRLRAALPSLPYFDNDGWMDIYLVNSGKCDFYNPPRPMRNALYRNNRDGTFTDVTQKAQVGAGGYGMGVAVGDYDGDGFPDLNVTQYGKSILYHNNGDGTFTNVTDKAGVATPGWTSSDVWFDYDNDGRLDLFVCQFAQFDKASGCGIAKDGKRTIAFRGSSSRCRVGYSTITATNIWAKPGAWSRQTLTMMDVWTSPWPMTPSLTFYS